MPDGALPPSRPLTVILPNAHSLDCLVVHTRSHWALSDFFFNLNPRAHRFKVMFNLERCLPGGSCTVAMSPDEIRARTQAVWDHFYSLRRIWARSRVTPTIRARIAFVLLSKLYRQMYANTGIATDSARVNRANRWARLIARPCRYLFTARPLPDLQLPAANGGAGVRAEA